MPQTQAFLTGKSARFGINAVKYDGKGWTVNPAAADLRVDNTSTNGYSDRIPGMRDCTFVVEMDWDASLNILDAAPDMKPGVVLSNTLLYLDDAGSGPNWNFPKALVLSTPMTALVDQVMKITTNCGNKGAFTPPTGSWVPSAGALS